MLPCSCLVWYVIDLLQNVNNIDIQPLIARIQRLISQVEQEVGFDLVSENSIKFLTARLTGIAQMLMNGINNFAVTLLTALLLLFFLLDGGIQMEQYIARLLPFNEKNKNAIIQNLTRIVRSNAIGIPLLALIQGCVASICYYFIKIPNGIEFGVLTGFASLIPIVGTMLVWIPLGISQYLDGNTMQCIAVLACGVLIISQCDNILRMFVLKRLANIHPLITISGVIIGLPIFGFMGLIFGPLLVSMFLLFLNMFAHQYILGEDIAVSVRTKSQRGVRLVSSNGATPEDNNSGSLNNSSGNSRNSLSSVNNSSSRQDNAGNANASNASNQLGSSTNSSSRNGSKSSGKGQNAAPASSRANTRSERSTEKNASTASNDKRPRPALDKKPGSNKKDFKTAKAEHKQQKRESAKLLAAAEKAAAANKGHSLDNLQVDITQPQVAPKTQAADRSADIFVSNTALTSTTATLESSQGSAKFIQTNVAAPPTQIAIKVKSANSNKTETRILDDLYAPKSSAQHNEDLHESANKQDFYAQPFGFESNNYEQRQLDGQSLVSRAVADALKPFSEEKFPEFSLSHENLEPLLAQTRQAKGSGERRKNANARANGHTDSRAQASKVAIVPTANEQAVNAASLEQTKSQDFEPTAEKRSETWANAQTKAQAKADSEQSESAAPSNKATKSDKSGNRSDKTDQQPRRLRNKQHDKAERRERNERHERKDSFKDKEKAERRERNERNDRSERNDRNKRGSDTKHAAPRNAKRNDALSKKRKSKNFEDKRHYSNNLGYEIFRPERKKHFEDEPILQTVVSHQYGNFDTKPKRTLRTQLISVHTAKGTMMATPPRRHPSKRRPYH